jgi:pectate lyase
MAIATGRLIAGVLLAAVSVGAELPDFPGAEGFGATTPGGRGGRVIYVTTLDDSGPGSLRAAIGAQGPRTILFRVGGVIDLQSALVVREPFVTIAGQTAPGGGICLRGDNFGIATHDVVVRFLRVRLGDLRRREVDTFSIADGSRNVVVDHCSASWSIDETLSPSGDISDVTVQWCIISESLNNSLHSKGPHGYGSLLRATGGVSLHHNLWSHHNGRNPRFGDNYAEGPFPTFDFRNNVIYNWGSAAPA